MAPVAPADRVVFEQTFEGLFVNALRERMSPPLARALKEQGLDLSQRLLPAYPVAVWTRCCQTAAKHLYASLPEEDGLRQLGEVVVEGFGNGFLGRALMGVVRVLGPHRALGRVRQNFRSGNNYAEATVTKIEGTDYEVWMNEVGPTRYVCQGIILAGLKATPAIDPRVEVVRFDDQAVWFRASWKT